MSSRKFLPSQEVGAVLLVGSTAFMRKLNDWDDFDLQIYTRCKPEWSSHYELLFDSGRRFLVSAYYLQIDQALYPK